LQQCADETGAWVVGPLYFEHEPEQSRLHMAGGVCRIQQDDQGRRYYLERHHHPHCEISQVDQQFVRCQTELIEFHTVLVSMAAFERLGPLDEGLLCNGEHGDLCLLVQQAGEKVFLEPNSRITYIPPRRLEPADREFFNLRWSEAWIAATIRHMAQKWNLSPDHPESRNSLQWVRNHRRYGSDLLAKMRKLVGRKLTSSLQKRLLNRLEEARSRREFPPQEFGVISAPQVRVVRQQVARPSQAA
jgi:hypothetical protein